MSRSGKRSVRTVWYVSYLVVLLVPIIASLLIYSVASDALNRQIKETNRVHLQLLSRAMESSVEYTNQMVDALIINPEFATIRNIGRNLTASSRFQLYRFIHNDLKQMQMSQFMTRQFLFFRRSNLILTNSVYQDAQRANDVILGDWNLSTETYEELLYSPQDRRYVPASIGATPVVLYAQSLPYGSVNPDVTLVVAFSQSAIIGVLDEAAWSGGGLVCVLDRDSDVVLATGNQELLTQEMIEQVAEETGENEISVGGRRYVFFNTGLNASGLRYLYIVPYDMVYRQASLVQVLTLLALAVGVLISLMLSGLLVRRNYTPVDTILKSLDHRGQGGNEYDRIITSIEQDKRERSDLSARLDENRRMLGGELLDRFLSGRMAFNATTYRMLSGYGLQMDAAAYSVVCLQADASGTAEDEYAMQDAAAELFRQHMQAAHPALRLFQSARRLPLIFVLGQPEAETDLVAALQACMDAVSGVLNVQLDMSLSNLSRDVSKLPDLYRQADTALEYAQMRADGRIVVYPEQGEVAEYYYQVEDELMLLEAIREGREEGIAAVLDGVTLRYTREPNVAMAQCLRFDLIATCYRVFAYADSVLPRESWWDDTLDRRLHRAPSIMELTHCVREMLGTICRAMQAHRAERKEDLSDRICAYVDQRWQEDGLSVATIADHFGMHTSYVSRMFKEEKGMGLLEYINRLRIERSVALLRSGKSIGEVAGQAGFASDASYIRVFKQYMGTTPGKYREMGTEKS